MNLSAYELLRHVDSGELWPPASVPVESGPIDVAAAYQCQLETRALRVARGERPRGFKIGFTNRGIWSRYNVFAPIWGTVWDTTLSFCEAAGEVDLAHTCQPRIEPELVFGLRASPPHGAGLQALFDAVDWIAPGFEIVQSHLPGWKFSAPESVADGALHGRLMVGRKLPVRSLAGNAIELDTLLAQSTVTLSCGDSRREQGQGSNVLDSPLRALHHFLQELRQCPGAPDLLAGDVVTTGTWTDAWPVAAGERWTAQFSAPLHSLDVVLR